MAQQQQQLLQLRGEQERVQRMIAQQRQMQWGGVNPKHNNKGANLIIFKFSTMAHARSYTWIQNT